MQDALTSGYYQILLLLFQNPLIRNVVSSFFLPNLRSPDVALQQCWPPGWQDTLSRHCWAAAALVKGLLGVAVLLLSVSKHALSHYHPIQPSCISLRAVYLVKYRLNLLWTLSWRCTPSAVFSSLLREREIAQGSVGNRNISLKQLSTIFLKVCIKTTDSEHYGPAELRGPQQLSIPCGRSGAGLHNSWGWGKNSTLERQSVPRNLESRRNRATRQYPFTFAKINQQLVTSRSFVRPPCFPF